MQLPPDPSTGPDREQDTFDFTRGTRGLPAELLRQIQEATERLTDMNAEQRKAPHAIAIAAVGATWIAPIVAGRRRRKRRRRQRRSA